MKIHKQKVFKIKIILFAILICGANQIFSQQKSIKKTIKPKMYIIIDNQKYLLPNKAFDKIEIGWILSSTMPSKENLEKGEPIIFYANNYYKENLYAAIGLKEDNNIYTTLSSYADFKYKEASTMEESIELYFKENYKVPDNLHKKKFWWKVYISAIVEKNGSLSDITVNSENANAKVTPSLIEFVKDMPEWIPATKSKEKVRSKCMFGVYFEWFNEK